MDLARYTDEDAASILGRPLTPEELSSLGKSLEYGFADLFADAVNDLREVEDEDEDPFAGLPFGEQQREVDWLETRYESEPEPYDDADDLPWD